MSNRIVDCDKGTLWNSYCNAYGYHKQNSNNRNSVKRVMKTLLIKKCHHNSIHHKQIINRISSVTMILRTFNNSGLTFLMLLLFGLLSTTNLCSAIENNKNLLNDDHVVDVTRQSRTIEYSNYTDYYDGLIDTDANIRVKRQPIYQNEFAVYIPNGADVANRIADKYGFTNLGQVSFFFFC